MATKDPVTKSAGRVTRALEESAETLEKSAGALDRETDQRTSLAADRTVLAAERTYAAWVRTGLAALASGIGARAVLTDAMPMWITRLTASVLILFAAFCFCAAVWRECTSLPPGKTRLNALPRSVLVAVNALLVLVTLAGLVVNWVK